MIEMVVALALLGLASVSILGAFEIGFLTLGSQGKQTNLVGNHDLLAIEQQIGADVNRAVCLKSPPQTAVGSCAQSVAASPSKCATAAVYFLCLAWYTPGAGAICHTVSYIDDASTGAVQRVDNHGVSARLSTGGLSLQTTWVGSGWPSTINLSAQQQPIAGAPTPRGGPVQTTFHLYPMATDPSSSLGNSPC